ncbi:hypothetical protein FM21_22210 [Streptomyces mutabilis]|uniref:Uncharacterized protein n=1 Tax=Streptomyces mutabilis TaxID=67332 RepID=A0A086MXA1_9ACTN|nr:hypothetical protein FM21_22210 [Streptomyces mutabilis]
MGSTTNQAVAVRNEESAGGTAAPSPTAGAEKRTALVRQWIASAARGATGVRRCPRTVTTGTPSALARALIDGVQPLVAGALAGPVLRQYVSRRQWLGLWLGTALGVTGVIAAGFATQVCLGTPRRDSR